MLEKKCSKPKCTYWTLFFGDVGSSLVVICVDLCNFSKACLSCMGGQSLQCSGCEVEGIHAAGCCYGTEVAMSL